MDQLNSNGQTSTVPASAITETDAVYEDKINKLAALTRRGIVKWHTVDASSIPTLSFARVLTAYEASFGGEKLHLVETNYEKQSSRTGLDPFIGRGGLVSLLPSARINERQEIVLSLYLLDLNGQPTFKFPRVEAIYDLFNEVKKQQSDVARFLSAIDAAAAATEEQQKQTDN